MDEGGLAPTSEVCGRAGRQEGEGGEAGGGALRARSRAPTGVCTYTRRRSAATLRRWLLRNGLDSIDGAARALTRHVAGRVALHPSTCASRNARRISCT